MQPLQCSRHAVLVTLCRESRYIDDNIQFDNIIPALLVIELNMNNLFYVEPI